VKNIVHFDSAQGFFVALSLANLCFLTVWRELLFAETVDAYWLPDYTAASYAAVIINVLGLALILWGILALLAGSSRPWLGALGRILFLVVLLIPLNYLRLVFGVAESSVIWAADHWLIALPVGTVVALSALYALLFHLRPLTQAIAIACLIFAPFALLNLGQAAWSAVRLSTTVLAETAPQKEPQKDRTATQRIVWLLMDELDLRLAFLQRPAGLTLPEFDRLRDQAFFAYGANSHSKNTQEAIPSFLVQKVVASAKPAGSANLHLTFANFENAPEGDLADSQHYFAEAVATGARIAIIGYYHPYCRLFQRYANYCSSYAMNTFTPIATHSLGAEIMSQIIGITPFFRRLNAISTYKAATDEATRLAADPNFDVVYFHASVPHGPNIWDLQNHSFTLFNTLKDGYFGNLVLADKLLGRIRESMERTNLWDKSVVLVTSDHEWRHVYLYDNQRIRKIPFLLKMPGQSRPFDFFPEFSAMRLTKDLLLRVQSQHIVTSKDAASWIEGARSGSLSTTAGTFRESQ
jgi:hypothetical protein